MYPAQQQKKSPYPTQTHPAYPPQQQYPPQQPAGYPPQGYPPQGYPPQGYPPQQQMGPPPPYTPQQPAYPNTAAPHHPGAYPQQPYPVYAQPPVHQGVAMGSFDSSARFGKGATANIPPPPPGCAPNAAQLAAMQGQPVAMTHRKPGWLQGSSSGGYTFW